MEQNKPYVVYSMRVANALIRKGYEMIGSRVNYKNPKYLVYLFEDTQELRQAVQQLTVAE